MNIKKFLTTANLIFIGILLLGIFLRFYQMKERFVYGHDHDLAFWIVKDILLNEHPRLIGQETSTQGIFIGPLYYYLQVPLFAIFRMDAIAEVVTSSLVGLFGIFTSYWVFSKTFDKRSGLIAGFLYAVSYIAVNNDREAVPTMPVIIWSIWFFYSLDLILKGKQKKGFFLIGILAGLIWHLSIALVIVLPLVVLAVILSKKRINLKWTIVGVIIVLILSAPLILFEIRHNFIQIQAFVRSLTSPQGDIYTGYSKFLRVFFLVNKNISIFIWNVGPLLTDKFVAIVLLTTAFILNLKKKMLNGNQGLLIFLWFVIYLLFFSIYSKTVSEYYLSGLFAVYLIVLSRFLALLYESKKMRAVALALIVLFGLYNLDRFLGQNIATNGYTQKRLLVSEIKKDSTQNGYPCVAISYITSPGYDLGYRYFFYAEDLHLNRISEKVPVYTIVFPLRKDNVKEDKAFGALGLIYPDYRRYPLDEVKKSCTGENINLTGSMFGYTQ